ncbi:hypothetical protein Poli38472_001636 [Pythium oligandrum]|uniref:3'-5' exonuclease domain-containing protein n=1 Tax=Pythium oligandrum TaxID=41045 RepID=A0A8K1FMK9_PYTOL|nr:hypothetical protein Poli38472_001636 [Pythium oligandrum]|eukprot:TMW69480.1 hypothetical protein Poli38472_001636 [Pythium oligandrum]
MVLTVSTLPWLPRNARPQARLVKQLLALVGDVPYEAQHVEFVAGHLDYTVNVCVAKELDDVLGLSEHASDEFFAFCFDALEREPLDKTLAMLMSSDELYVLETVERCINVLAERYVTDHTSVVSTNAILSFFQPPPEHEKEAFEAWQELRRRFLRELITLESENETDAAVLTTTRRAISEFHLEHDAEIMPHIARPTAKPKKHTIESFLTLELPSDLVVVVDDAKSLALANEVLMPTPLKGAIRRVGIDVEWRPESLGGSRSRCALLQLATDSHVFLFDLIAISMDSLAPTFQHVLSSPDIVKLGFALDGDFIRLRESFPLAECFDHVENVQDLACIAHRRRSLKCLVKDVLGQPLDKREQCSDWEARPLTPDQITYAALDAYCLLLVQDQLP